MDTNPQQPDDLVTATREQAQAQIAELSRDTEWQRARFNGDSQKQAHWSALHDAAYGTEPAGGAFGVQSVGPAERPREPEAAPGAQIPEDGVLRPGMEGYDEAAAEAFAPPAGPHGYKLEPLGGGEATDADVAQIMSASHTLFEAGVPAFAVQVVQQVAQHNVRGLKRGESLSDDQLASMRNTCIATLRQKHGPEADALIADAQKAVSRVLSNQTIRDYLEDTGAGSDPHVIETLARVWRERFAKG